MRILVLLCVALVAACASIDTHGELAPGQVWRLKASEYPDARVRIGAIQTRKNRKVVHISVFGLPGPSAATPLFAKVIADRKPGDPSPSKFIMSGVGGDASLSSAEISISPDLPATTITIARAAVYADELLPAVSAREETSLAAPLMFDDEMQIWNKGERRWPELNDSELKRPLFQRLTTVLAGVAEAAASPRLADSLGPTPPASAGPAEIAIDDPALDRECRAIVSPPPLDPKFVARMIKEGFKRDEIPEIDVTLSNVRITSDEKLGHIWRADSHDKRAASNEGMERAICWRKDSNQPPAATWSPLPPAPG